jgi:pyruvate ferredoxin oxidoreductase beta subunit
VKGKLQAQKDITAIMEAHNLPYVATASACHPLDLYEKVKKARGIHGTRFMHVFVPCPPGWRFDFSDTVKIGRLAVETGWVVLYEIENGIFRLTDASESMAKKSGKLRPLIDYLSPQERFRSISKVQVEAIQSMVEKRWQRLLVRAGYK